jgi:transposase-like protein
MNALMTGKDVPRFRNGKFSTEMLSRYQRGEQVLL